MKELIVKARTTYGGNSFIQKLADAIERLTAELAEKNLTRYPEPNEIREMLRAMQAGELTVSRGVELIGIWIYGNYSDDLLPPVRQDLIEEDSMPVEIIDRLKAELAEARKAAPKESDPVAWAAITENGKLFKAASTKESAERKAQQQSDKFGTAWKPLTVVPLFLHPAPADRDALDAKRYRWLREQHDEQLPMAAVVWKKGSIQQSDMWCNMIDGADLDKHIDAAMRSGEVK